ncbi:hypothetical protein H0E87_012672 [Populus deltoides]|uniref:SAC domain-containing protein n=1 Tax=Populus deltoides TaxID=3696 RepID=A0A8T2YK97_POPDE|nr:hypothetical protein H0E87_012672 [Populus deltoides]
MASSTENEGPSYSPRISKTAIDEEEEEEEELLPPPDQVSMQKFRLYKTQSNFYMIGRDKSRTYWRVLKIDRLDPSELNIREDSTTYTERECYDLLRRLHEGNKATGGLKFVTTCYGIVVCKSEMIPLPNSAVQSSISDSMNENRYKKLLCTVDLTKDFFFSYSYHVMRSLQKNLCDRETGQVLYETMFVWNEFLTRGIRNHLQNTLWTVALVYGFFKQATLFVSGREFKLTLIARRSRHYAGTRYLKRGVNEKGRVANDVETEQIVFEDVPEGFPMQISSVVQNRGSIPLFWSQETSRLIIKPDIILSKKDQNYEATRLHFENLAKRYGNPIIILNLIKTQEKKPRESILCTEFANAIDHINKNLSEENHLRFLHWDLHKHSKRNATNVLLLLGKVAAYALTLTGFFYCQVTSDLKHEGCMDSPFTENAENGNLSPQYNSNNDNEDGSNLEEKSNGGNSVVNGNHSIKCPMLQMGVLRTNCIDCLDRTNVAQYAFGLAALGHQLNAVGVVDNPKIDLDAPLADDLMGFYERMGDTLAHQYGGSAAHNKIFSERRGQLKAATQSQEFFRTLQRYYSNAYMDAEKQDAINLDHPQVICCNCSIDNDFNNYNLSRFLGHIQPQQGKPALWELDSDQHHNVGRNGQTNVDEDARFHDSNILRGSGSPLSAMNARQQKFCRSAFPDQFQEENNVLSKSSPEISTCESDIAFSRYTPSMPRRQLFRYVQRDRYLESDNVFFSGHGDTFNCSNFVDIDWLSSSGNSCEEEPFERSSLLTNYPISGLSSENVNGIMGGTTPSTIEYGSSTKELTSVVKPTLHHLLEPQSSSLSATQFPYSDDDPRYCHIHQSTS